MSPEDIVRLVGDIGVCMLLVLIVVFRLSPILDDIRKELNAIKALLQGGR